MKDTGLDSDDLLLPKRAEGYRPGPHGIEIARSESMSIPWSACAIYSTTGDLLKWEHGLFGGKVLNTGSLKLMTTPGKGDYGFGVFIQTQDGVRVVSHGGGIEGFNTHLAYAPEKQIAVIVLSNVNGGAPGSMGGQLMDAVLGKPVVLASERKAVPIAKEELTKFVGVYDLTPTFALTVAVSGDHLTGQGSGQPALDMIYQGLRDGHPIFFTEVANAEIEFVPGANGAITSLILHQGGGNIPAKKR
jgi:CubicO group peptidase (beta-lactamase class C family)